MRIFHQLEYYSYAGNEVDMNLDKNLFKEYSKFLFGNS